MKEILKKYFYNNFTLKIISIFFATLLWFVVMDNTNPINTIQLSVPLKIQNENILLQKGLSIKNKNYPKNITVTIKGRKDKISTVNINDIEAILDFSKVDSISTKVLYIDAFLNKDGATLKSITPRAINLNMEKIGENYFPIEVISVGNLKDSYKIIKITTFPEIISVQNTDSIIKSIGSVKVFVDVDNLDKSIEVKKNCNIYNKNGMEIIDLAKNTSVTVKIEVAKEVNIVPVIIGTPSKNYINVIKTVNPSKALIEGDSQILDKITELRTEPIDVENQSENINKTSIITLPEGVKLVDTPSSVSVDISIEQSKKNPNK